MIRQHHHHRPGWPRHDDRRGAVLVVALVCLLVVMTLLGTMLQGTLLARRQLRVECDRRQTDLLLQAGVDRAVLRLGNQRDYRGETWNLSREMVAGHGAAQVTIAAARNADDEPFQVRVVAEYPLGSELSIRRSREFFFRPPSSYDQE